MKNRDKNNKDIQYHFDDREIVKEIFDITY